jgi:hypothetical protein
MAKPEQEQLFSDIETLSLRVDALKGFVQNDIDGMLEDGYTTRTEIIRSISEAENFFEKCGKELESLKVRVVCLLSSYCKDFPMPEDKLRAAPPLSRSAKPSPY